MNWDELRQLQKELDDRIMEKVEKTREDVKDDKLLAFMVELAELANETRCFKYWSEKGPSARHIILEEYVDGVHFLISIGLDYTYDFDPTAESTEKTLTEQFHQIYDLTQRFKLSPIQENYQQLITNYLALGKTLGFHEADIFEAYKEKNEVNHERQESGY